MEAVTEVLVVPGFLRRERVRFLLGLSSAGVLVGADWVAAGRVGAVVAGVLPCSAGLWLAGFWTAAGAGVGFGGMMMAEMACSTSLRLRLYMRRECSMMTLVLSACAGGSSRVFAENAGTFSPPMTMLMMKLRLCICKMSAASKLGSNCLDKIGASSAETRNDIVVPTLPNTASRTVSFI